MREEKVKRFGLVTMMLSAVLVLIPGGMILAQVQKNGTMYGPKDPVIGGAINWLSAEEAYEKNKITPKPFFIDVYTDWCGWCKRMDATTFKDPVIAKYLNDNFYAVKFDAESKDTVNFLNHQYYNSQAEYVKNYLNTQDSLVKVLNDSIRLLGTDTTKIKEVQAITGRLQGVVNGRNQMARNGKRTSHDFARDLMNNQMSYPTFVILFDSLKQNFPLKGYQQPNQLISVLSFFAEGVYRQTSDLQAYNNLFSKTITEQSESPSFLSIEKAEMAAKTNKKKTVILVAKEDLYTSMMLEKGTLQAPEVKQILDESFNLAKISVYSKDTVEFQGTIFANQRGYHDLALALTKNQVIFPCLAILDEEQRLIMPIPGFFLPSEMVIVLNYLKEDAYKSKTYIDYKKDFLSK